MAAAIWTFSLTLGCCLLFTRADTSPACTQFAVLGESYRVRLWTELKQEHRLIWKHNSLTIYDSSKGERNLNKIENGNYIIPQVTGADQGRYTWELYLKITGKLLNQTDVFLCVREAVSKPSVTVKCDEKKVQFTCSVTPTQDVTYRWFEGSKVIENANAKTLVRYSKQVGSNSFHCEVSNKASSAISDSVRQDCSKPDEEKGLFGLDFWLIGILAGGGGLVMVLIVATVICCSINRRKRRMQIKEEHELRLKWSTGTNQPPHAHQQVKQRGPAHGHASRPPPGQDKAPLRDSAGHTGPRPPRARQPRPRPPDPITGQPLPGPRRLANPSHTQAPVNDEETPPPLPQPRKINQRRT